MTVIWIANLKRWKQPELFVRLANRLSDTGVHFVMVGAPADASGNESWQTPLLQDIEGAPNLSYLGPKTQEQVNALLARAHIFVNTVSTKGFQHVHPSLAA